MMNQNEDMDITIGDLIVMDAETLACALPLVFKSVGETLINSGELEGSEGWRCIATGMLSGATFILQLVDAGLPGRSVIRTSFRVAQTWGQ